MADNKQFKDAAGDTFTLATVQVGSVDHSTAIDEFDDDGTIRRVSTANPKPVTDAALSTKVGEVQASPTANTVLGRLKDLLTGIVLSAGSALIGRVQLRNNADDANIDPPSSAQLPSALVGGRLDVNVGAGVSALATSAKQDSAQTALDAIQTAVEGTLAVSVGNFPAAQPVTDNGGSLTVDGSVTANPTRPSSAAVTSPSADTSEVEVLASNANRLGAMVYNDSSDDLYLKFGAGATTSSFTVKILAGGYFELPQPVFTGALSGVWTGTDGAARATEVTA